MPRNGLKRYKTMGITDELLKNLTIARPVGKILLQGYEIDVDTDRYENFYRNGTKCVSCGLEASFAAIERNASSKGKFHLNLYGLEGNKEIVMTRDHIYPRALGGYDDIHNYQTMCERCNNRKKDKTDLTPEQAIELGYTDSERVAAAAEIQKEYDKYLELQAVAAAQKKVVDDLKSKYGELLPPRDKSEFLDI